MSEFVKLSRDEAVATVTINRPEALNALDPQVLGELERCFEELEHDLSVKVVILTGVKKAFVAGADIASMSKMTPEEAVEFSRLGQRVFNRVASMRPVVIAAVNGFALGGGCELAMACDIRVAAESARLGIPETSLGVFPGFAGTQRLPRLVGLGVAKEMLATAQKVSAQRAYEIGLVNHVAPNEELMSFCGELAKTILKNSSTAIAAGKKLMDMGIEMDVDRAQDYEAALFGVAFSTADQKEGMSAFLEKRPPAFQ